MSETQIRAAIEAERRAQVDLLASLRRRSGTLRASALAGASGRSSPTPRCPTGTRCRGSWPGSSEPGDVIHGLDVSTGLGREDTAPPERVVMVLRGLEPEQLTFFGVDLAGVELRATDADWSYGAGEPVSGRARDLLLLASGRRLPAGRLGGAAAGRFAAGPVG